MNINKLKRALARNSRIRPKHTVNHTPEAKERTFFLANVTNELSINDITLQHGDVVYIALAKDPTYRIICFQPRGSKNENFKLTVMPATALSGHIVCLCEANEAIQHKFKTTLLKY